MRYKIKTEMEKLSVNIVAFIFTVTFVYIEAKHEFHDLNPDYNPFLSKHDAAAFLRKTRSAVDCYVEVQCETNPDYCTTETIREEQCRGKVCGTGYVCYMTVPCPAHYKSSCKEDACNDNPCQNGGTCVTQANFHACICPLRYIGENCTEDTCSPSNSNGSDIIFVVDSTLSVGDSLFEAQKEYIRNFVRTFTIGPSNFQVAIVSYALNPEIHCHLSTHDNQTTLLEAIDQMVYNGGSSYTDRALKTIRETVLTTANGMRSSLPQYVIVLTDGLSSNMVETATQATSLKYTGTEVLTVAFGSQIYHTELLDIASHSSRIFPRTLPDALNSVLKQNMQSCPECTRNTSDVILLFDSSTDLNVGEYYPAIDGIRTLVSGMPIGPNNIHVSYVKYAKDVYEEFDFTQYQTSGEIISHITTSRARTTGPANLGKAFDHVINSGFDAGKGARENARQFVVAFTQGRYDDFDLVKASADALKNTGVILSVFGTGNNANMTALLEIASEPFYAFVIGEEVDIDYDVLLSLTGSFEFDSCDYNNSTAV